ncbi:Hypothetical protein FKW44_003471 [Caligus rogercresseyi]|uniref:Uncharacterized protein n=1 Tax=Caligus rogercresseyi TaxID=217165 RepID=A0A7T8KLS6_CALRO|nr:Hypothetical protein FKW44_003471 [Caligus rogercresseyi]
MSPFPSHEAQRLIHAGKLLSDEDVLGSFLKVPKTSRLAPLTFFTWPSRAVRRWAAALLS